MVRGNTMGEQQELGALRPGGLLHYDYRTDAAKTEKLPETFRVVQWNIERGIQFERIVQTLRVIRADVLLLQEVDINCRRSDYRNVARDLAEALKMEMYFACEFEELDAVDRAPKNAVGPLSSPATAICGGGDENNGSTSLYKRGRHFHGNAILSAGATLSDPRVIRHTAGIDWETEGWKRREPRHGFRNILRCCIHRSERTHSHIPDLYLYCCHFEVFCGALSRVRQLLDVFRDATSVLNEGRQHISSHSHYSKQQHPAFIIAGDLNTLADGIVRLSLQFDLGRLRLLSFGEKEACWLQRKVLSRRMHHVTRGCCPFSYHYPYYVLTILYESIWNSDFAWRWLYGFSTEEIAALDNRHLCFYDPSDKALSITLDDPAYYGFVFGKLDWLLLSNLTVAPPSLTEEALNALKMSGSITAETASSLSLWRQNMLLPMHGYVTFNEHFEASDHKGLLMHIQQQNSLPKETYPEYGATYTASWVNVGFFTFTRVLPWAVTAFVIYKRWQRCRHV
ncbi:putative Endonuclease/Exonuclease/phosphatase family [Trypanosoma cruzi]|nr:putative Endonuclease/Exonuclease/phosphatase family [Trypanosoma cruzi]